MTQAEPFKLCFLFECKTVISSPWDPMLPVHSTYLRQGKALRKLLSELFYRASMFLTSSRQEFNNSGGLIKCWQFTCCNMSGAHLQQEPQSTSSLECGTICSSASSYCSCSTSPWCPVLHNSYSERDLLTATAPPIPFFFCATDKKKGEEINETGDQ